MNRLANVALALTRFSERWIPSSFVIALVLTLVAFVLALLLTPTTPLAAVRHWGDGFWELLSFGMQMTLVMFSGYIVAVSPPVDRALGIQLSRRDRASVASAVAPARAPSRHLHRGVRRWRPTRAGAPRASWKDELA